MFYIDKEDIIEEVRLGKELFVGSDQNRNSVGKTFAFQHHF